MAPPLPLVYIYTSDKHGIRGSIRFQKLVFLGQEESKLPETYRFVPYKYGPYSYQLEKDIENLMNSGHIVRNTRQNKAGNYRTDYSLSPSGFKLTKNLLRNGFERLFEVVHSINSKYGGERLSDLIEYVYREYPEYTDESTLDIERIFDEPTTSQFTEQDQSQVGSFNQIRKLSEKDGIVAGIDKSFVRQLLEIGSEFRATLERISDDSLSIYWRSLSPSLRSFTETLIEDTAVPADAPCEMRTRNSGDWIQGECNELIEILNPETCLFFRAKAQNNQYTVTWEAGREGNGDEVTLHMSESQLDYQTLRAALVQYATATALEPSIVLRSPVDTSDDEITESFRQTAKLAVS